MLNRPSSLEQTVVFSIDLVNGDSAQDSRAVSASVNGILPHLKP